MNGIAHATWAGEEFLLYPQKAILWVKERSLLIADPHFGKASAFRHAGVPIPMGTTADDIQRLDNLLDDSGATRLIILGDFFHHKTGRCEATISTLAAWRGRRANLDIVLIRGNHDRHAGDPPGEWNFRTVPEPFAEGPFLFCHEPCKRDGGFVFGGHIHPCVTLRDSARTPLRVPCFWFGAHVATLPAFGGLTGMYPVRPKSGDMVFAVGPNEVVKLRGVPQRFPYR